MLDGPCFIFCLIGIALLGRRQLNTFKVEVISEPSLMEAQSSVTIQVWSEADSAMLPRSTSIWSHRIEFGVIWRR